MKKFLFWFFLLIALAAIGYFVVYPYVNENYIKPRKADPVEVALTGKENLANSSSLFEEGWVELEVWVYVPRDINSLEKDFQDLGYPPFLYMKDETGNLGRREKSTHENGMEVYLTMNETGYLMNAELDYAVDKSRFSSTAMSENIPPFLDFIRIITNKEVSEEDQKLLLRAFTNVFNDSSSKNNTIRINELDFQIAVDSSLYPLIIMKC